MFAVLQLGDLNILIGFVRLVDGAGAADDGGVADLLKEAALGAVAHHQRLIAAGQVAKCASSS